MKRLELEDQELFAFAMEMCLTRTFHRAVVSFLPRTIGVIVRQPLKNDVVRILDEPNVDVNSTTSLFYFYTSPLLLYVLMVLNITINDKNRCSKMTDIHVSQGVKEIIMIIRILGSGVNWLIALLKPNI